MLYLSKTVVLCLALFFCLNLQIASCFGASESSPSPMKGYSRNLLHIPAEGLTEEERKMCEFIQKINNVLVKSRDVTEIMNQIFPVLSDKFSSADDDLRGTNFSLDFIVGTTGNLQKFVNSISIRFPSDPLPRIQIQITGPNSIIDNDQGFVISVTYLTSEYRRLAPGIYSHEIVPQEGDTFAIFNYYKNGHLRSLSYRDCLTLAQVNRRVTWSEEGKFLEKKTITKPIPFIVSFMNSDDQQRFYSSEWQESEEP